MAEHQEAQQKSGVFGIGEKNTAYAKYFVGQSYLNMLTTERVVTANVTFEPGCRNNWHIHKADRFCSLRPAAAIIRNGANRHRNFMPATSSTFRRKSNIGTALPKTAGLPM